MTSSIAIEYIYIYIYEREIHIKSFRTKYYFFLIFFYHIMLLIIMLNKIWCPLNMFFLSLILNYFSFAINLKKNTIL